MDLSSLSPVEIDTVLAANYAEQMRLEDAIRAHATYIEMAWVVERPKPVVEEAEAKLEALREKLHAAIIASAPYEAEYYKRDWNRYFLVQNDNGHVHRGMNCGTCYPTTRYTWLVELADCDEAAMIEQWGEKACTACFPDAPRNPLYHRPSRLDREALVAREVEKAVKAAEKAAKAERIAQREAKAAAKAAQVEADKAAGTHKLSPAEKRDAAIGRIVEAGQAGDWDKVRAEVEAAKALGKTDRWQSALRGVEASLDSHGTRFIQSVINLGWANV